MTLTADQQVHANVVNAWKAHKDRTGISQTRAAQSLGIGQSAFHQYLKGKANGGIPLNRTFVVKFAKLTGVSPADLGWTDSEVLVREAFLPVRYTSEGLPLVDEKIAIESIIVPSTAEFAVRVESANVSDLLQKDDIYLCSEKAEMRDGQNVFVVHSALEGKRETYIGRLRKSVSSKWEVTCSHGGATFSVDIPDKAKVFPIVAVYFRR